MSFSASLLLCLFTSLLSSLSSLLSVLFFFFVCVLLSSRYLVLGEEVQMNSRTGMGGLGIKHAEALEQGMIKSVPLLEAFGCAQTINNVNSSRFGKYLKLQYSPSGAVQGAATTTFMLEKSRVVQHSAGERTFHVMYRLCDGASDDERAAWKLEKNPLHYHFLNQGDVGMVADEAGGLEAIKDQLSAVRGARPLLLRECACVSVVCCR